MLLTGLPRFHYNCKQEHMNCNPCQQPNMSNQNCPKLAPKMYKQICCNSMTVLHNLVCQLQLILPK